MKNVGGGSQAGEGGGLAQAEAEARFLRHGPNVLPQERAPSILAVFIRQFASPLIYILLLAGLVSAATGDMKDAFFIGLVLLLNGMIGTAQEYSAGRAAAELKKLQQPHAMVIRDGRLRELPASELVPGDLVLLSAGGRVPADIGLVSSEGLLVDESLLTGESMPVRKQAMMPSGVAGVGAASLALAGTMVTRGRARGTVVATGAETALGKIARLVNSPDETRPPLLVRMERFARTIAYAVGVAIVALVLAGLARGMGAEDLFLMSVGLAVSAIPEGLPVAVSVALAIGMRRMAAANVIVRRMPAIEALGSCTIIATDKTGTLTLNELTVTEVLLPDGTRLEFEAKQQLDQCAIVAGDMDLEEARRRASALLRAAALPNEASIEISAEGWTGTGDTVDVALLAAAHKAGLQRERISTQHPLISSIPYEPEQRYAASFHQGRKGVRVFVKGAPDTLIAMSDRMEWDAAALPADHSLLRAQKEELAGRGLRVLAFAEGEIEDQPDGRYGHHHLANLTFLGLAGMQDPVRPEVPQAVRACYSAGVDVAMLTGDDPQTACAIAIQAGLRFQREDIVTGDQLRVAQESGKATIDALTQHCRVFARVEPSQKLEIVRSLARNGNFVAVTGDGVNDAPALRHAHVGVAMGRMGTDVAKASASIIVTDDNFASIVAGIREGRVAYANIRKVIQMVISTGAAEVVLFLLAIPLGLPMPLLPVQLLWLNLVTNGIQDVALAAEAAEGDELMRPARRPSEPIFDLLMIRRVLLATLVMGVGGFALFWWLLKQGVPVAEARNQLLLLFVLFENFQTLNCRSEYHSIFGKQPFGNPFLITGIVAAQSLQIVAMHIPALQDLLGLSPVSPTEWIVLGAVAATVTVVMEIDKYLTRPLGSATLPNPGQTSPGLH